MSNVYKKYKDNPEGKIVAAELIETGNVQSKIIMVQYSKSKNIQLKTVQIVWEYEEVQDN